MTTGWAVYGLVVGGLLSGAALGADGVLRVWGGPWGRSTRWVWLLAGLATAGLTLAPLAMPDGGPVTAEVRGEAEAVMAARADVRVVPLSAGAALAPVPEGQPSMTATAASLLGRRLPRGASVAWLAGTAALLSWLLAGALGTLLRSRRWPAATVLGTTVRVSGRTGPAVIGLLRPRIVLPRRLLSLDPARLEAVLRHEDEHRRAHDLRLIALFLAILVVLPWQPFLWWQLRRLRLAVEADCDARTVAGLDGLDTRDYGRLLLSEAARPRAHRPLLSAALGDPAWLLERRIRLLLGRRPGGRTMVAGMLTAALGVLVACEVPAPTGLSPDEDVEGPSLPSLASTPWSAAPVRMELGRDVMKAVVAAGVDGHEGAVALAVELSPDGSLRSVRVDAVAGGAEVSDAAVAVMRRARFTFLGAEEPPAEGGWFPVWVTFHRSGVTATLVDEDLYRREGLADGAPGRARMLELMDTYDRLRSGLTSLRPSRSGAPRPSMLPSIRLTWSNSVVRGASDGASGPDGSEPRAHVFTGASSVGFAGRLPGSPDWTAAVERKRGAGR